MGAAFMRPAALLQKSSRAPVEMDSPVAVWPLLAWMSELISAIRRCACGEASKAPPIRPPTTAAPTPRCALAGVAASEPAIVATAIKAANVFFLSLALLEFALSGGAGFRVTHTPCSKLAVQLESAPQSTDS